MLVLVLIDCENNFLIFGFVEQTKAAAYEESFKKGFLMGGMYLKVQSIFLKHRDLRKWEAKVFSV